MGKICSFVVILMAGLAFFSNTSCFGQQSANSSRFIYFKGSVNGVTSAAGQTTTYAVGYGSKLGIDTKYEFVNWTPEAKLYKVQFKAVAEDGSNLIQIIETDPVEVGPYDDPYEDTYTNDDMLTFLEAHGGEVTITGTIFFKKPIGGNWIREGTAANHIFKAFDENGPGPSQ